MSRKEMWSKFRKVDTQRQQLAVAREKMEEQEVFACEQAGRAGEEVARLTKKFGRLARENGENCICLKVKIVFPLCRGMDGRNEKSGRGKPE